MCLHLLYLNNEPKAEHTALPARKVSSGWRFLCS